jgi:hypothetical protein
VKLASAEGQNSHFPSYVEYRPHTSTPILYITGHTKGKSEKTGVE